MQGILDVVGVLRAQRMLAGEASIIRLDRVGGLFERFFGAVHRATAELRQGAESSCHRRSGSRGEGSNSFSCL